MQFIRVTAEIHVAEMLNRWLISQRWVLLLVWYWGETDGQKWCRDNSSENSSGMISWFERQHWTSSGVWCSYFSVHRKKLPLQRSSVGSVCLLWASPWKEKQVLSHFFRRWRISSQISCKLHVLLVKKIRVLYTYSHAKSEEMVDCYVIKMWLRIRIKNCWYKGI